MGRKQFITVDGRKVYIRGLRLMKRLGALRADGIYYYPGDAEFERLAELGLMFGRYTSDELYEYTGARVEHPLGWDS